MTVFGDDHGHEMFLPFADATSGEGTYASGRYLDVQKWLVHNGYGLDPLQPAVHETDLDASNLLRSIERW